MSSGPEYCGSPISFTHVPDLVPCSYDDNSTDPSPSPPMVSAHLSPLPRLTPKLIKLPTDVLQPQSLYEFLRQSYIIPSIYRHATANHQFHRIHRSDSPPDRRPPTTALKYISRQRDRLQYAHSAPSPESCVPTRFP